MPAELFQSRLDEIFAAMCHTVEGQRHRMKLRLMPGVEETLSHLAHLGALLGVATGNLERIGWIKIEEAGLRKWFRLGGFSDHFSLRAEMIGNAARKAREIAGASARVCVVGDTPRDIEAAHANSLPVIAVATGNFSFDELLEHRPELCASSLVDLLASTQVAP
jgi:phosphoglycolate phosphatase-like HAD superfamily hydrolase